MYTGSRLDRIANLYLGKVFGIVKVVRSIDHTENIARSALKSMECCISDDIDGGLRRSFGLPLIFETGHDVRNAGSQQNRIVSALRRSASSRA